MRVDTKVRICSLCYLVCAYAIAVVVMALFADFVVAGVAIDLWRGEHTVTDYFELRKLLLLKLSGLGAIIGFVVWFFFYRKQSHHDPLDKYFK